MASAAATLCSERGGERMEKAEGFGFKECLLCSITVSFVKAF